MSEFSSESNQSDNGSSTDGSINVDTVCYTCGEPGHKRRNCPLGGSSRGSASSGTGRKQGSREKRKGSALAKAVGNDLDKERAKSDNKSELIRELQQSLKDAQKPKPGPNDLPDEKLVLVDNVSALPLRFNSAKPPRQISFIALIVLALMTIVISSTFCFLAGFFLIGVPLTWVASAVIFRLIWREIYVENHRYEFVRAVVPPATDERHPNMRANSVLYVDPHIEVYLRTSSYPVEGGAAQVASFFGLTASCTTCQEEVSISRTMVMNLLSPYIVVDTRDPELVYTRMMNAVKNMSFVNLPMSTQGQTNYMAASVDFAFHYLYGFRGNTRKPNVYNTVVGKGRAPASL